MKRVSVLIPLHNCEKTIRRSMMSVKNQTYQDMEVIAVDNNCTDSTISIVKEFGESLDIKVVECAIPGITPALNEGLRHCNGEFVARLDGDDFWYPEKLEKQISFLDENSSVGVIGTQIRLLDVEGNVEEIGTMGRKVNYPIDDQQIKSFLMYGQNPICHPAVVIRRELFSYVGGYEHMFPKAEDLHLWLKLFVHTKFSNIDEVLVDYTQRKDSDYDARIPVILGDMYYSLYKKAGLIKGDRKERVWDWQLDSNHHGNVR